MQNTNAHILLTPTQPSYLLHYQIRSMCLSRHYRVQVLAHPWERTNFHSWESFEFVTRWGMADSRVEMVRRARLMEPGLWIL
jgi:hypothetical protein